MKKEYLERETLLRNVKKLQGDTFGSVLIVSEIERMPAADANMTDWIKVEDHLPNINEEVICYRGSHIGGMKDVYTYKGDNKWEDSYGYFNTTEDEGITYWTELPPDPMT